MFRLIANVRGGATSFPLTAVSYATIEEARVGAKHVMHENARVVRIMVVRDEIPTRFVEWIERS